VAEIDATLGEATAREAAPAPALCTRTSPTKRGVKQMVQHAREAFGHVDVLLKNSPVAPSARTRRLPKLILRSGPHINLDLKGRSCAAGTSSP